MRCMKKNDRKFHFINNAVPLLKLDLQKASSHTCRFLNERRGRLIEKTRYARTF